MKYLLIALVIAASPLAHAQSYEQRAAAERMAEDLAKIDKANMERARAQQAPTTATASQRRDTDPLLLLVACGGVVLMLAWAIFGRRK